MKKQMERRGHGWRKRAAALTLGLALGVLGGCSDILDVNNPSQLGDDALTDPRNAQVLLNSVIAQFEDGYDFSVYNNLGREDGGEVYLCGPMCNVSNYQTAVSSAAGTLFSGDSNGDFGLLARSLRFATDLHNKIASDP